ncbi:MAG: hypothetical protein ACJAVV_002226 [Alphaproteobacteria bacterium]|jgi:hypothetical protein
MLCSTSVNAEMPIYAAYASDELVQECENLEQSQCQLNAFDGETLTALLASLPSGMMIEDALSVSEYEVLIGNAIININEQNQHAELVLEITTSWRQVPIDDFILRQRTSLADIDQTASAMLSDWAQHIETNLVLEADKIYQVLGASDYVTELSVPQNIGDFIRMQSAVYRDPLLGSITRYSHPRFDSAVVDISVYPFSPFLTPSSDALTLVSGNLAANNGLLLQLEMENEITQIKQLIANANIQDFTISSINPATITVNGVLLEGLRLEVLLYTNTDPEYSTQYIFQQNDKIIKLTGNLPEFMMNELVSESLPKIKVPGESSFMRTLRQG